MVGSRFNLIKVIHNYMRKWSINYFYQMISQYFGKIIKKFKIITNGLSCRPIMNLICWTYYYIHMRWRIGRVHLYCVYEVFYNAQHSGCVIKENVCQFSLESIQYFRNTIMFYLLLSKEWRVWQWILLVEFTIIWKDGVCCYCTPKILYNYSFLIGI